MTPLVLYELAVAVAAAAVLEHAVLLAGHADGVSATTDGWQSLSTQTQMLREDLQGNNVVT